VKTDHINPDSDNDKNHKENGPDEKGDKLRGSFGLFLRRLGDPEGIDERIGEEEKGIHDSCLFLSMVTMLRDGCIRDSRTDIQ
jgi:hypothetical protein